ncbi:unnamed protein product, partial [Chrysoparadoxa australica]
VAASVHAGDAAAAAGDDYAHTLALKAWQAQRKGKPTAEEEMSVDPNYIWHGIVLATRRLYREKPVYMDSLTNINLNKYGEATVHVWKGRWMRGEHATSSLRWGAGMGTWSVTLPAAEEGKLKHTMNVKEARDWAKKQGRPVNLAGMPKRKALQAIFEEANPG